MVSGEKVSNRDIYEISYDKDAIDGDLIDAEFSNGPDVSVYKGANDGKFIVTVATGYSGTADVIVEGSVGGSDSGTVVFG